MLRSLTHPSRAALCFGAVAAFAYCLAIGGVSFLREAEIRDHFNLRVESDLRFRINELNNYRDNITRDLSVFATMRDVRELFPALSSAFDVLGEARVRQLYIDLNPHPRGKKQDLDEAVDGSSYSKLHGNLHRGFRSQVEMRNYYDFIFLRSDGRIIYSVGKEDDFGRSVKEAPLEGSVLGRVFARSIDANPGSIVTEDFAPYGPSGDGLFQFIGTPVYARGNVVGVIVIQARSELFASVMRTDKSYFSGLKSYIVNTEGRNLTDPGASVASVSVGALKGASGTMRTKGGAGNDVYAAYAPFDWFGLKWAAVTELDNYIVVGRKYAGVVPLTLLGLICVLFSALAGWLLGERDSGSRTSD